MRKIATGDMYKGHSIEIHSTVKILVREFQATSFIFNVPHLFLPQLLTLRHTRLQESGAQQRSGDWNNLPGNPRIKLINLHRASWDSVQLTCQKKEVPTPRWGWVANFPSLFILIQCCGFLWLPRTITPKCVHPATLPLELQTHPANCYLILQLARILGISSSICPKLNSQFPQFKKKILYINKPSLNSKEEIWSCIIL